MKGGDRPAEVAIASEWVEQGEETGDDGHEQRRDGRGEPGAS